MFSTIGLPNFKIKYCNSLKANTKKSLSRIYLVHSISKRIKNFEDFCTLNHQKSVRKNRKLCFFVLVAILLRDSDAYNYLHIRSNNKITANESQMESEFVLVNNVPMRVDSWGGYLPSKILEKSQERPRELILMIPGNPGVTKFYEKFLNHLYEKIRKPIWILSHGGHDINKKMPSLKNNKHLYTLQGLVDQKDQFIKTYLEGVTLYCVGHSIGCKMLLELLKADRKYMEIEKCIMLFPALERMAEAPNASYVIFVINYILWLTLFGSWVFVYLPKILQVVLIRIYCLVMSIPPDNISAIRCLIDPYVLNKVFFLADDEMKHVKELDDETLKLHGHKIKLYYGAADGWAPLKYYKELTEKHKNVDAEVCKKGYQHTFVLKESQQMADLVSMWLKK